MTYEQLLSRLTDLQRLATPAHGERTGCCSRYDRRSRYDEETGRYVDWDANDDGKGYIRALPDGSVVAAGGSDAAHVLGRGNPASAGRSALTGGEARAAYAPIARRPTGMRKGG